MSRVRPEVKVHKWRISTLRWMTEPRQVGQLTDFCIFLDLGNAKEDDALETLGDERLQEGNYAVQTHAFLVGKGGNRGLFIWVVGDENWVDEHALGQLALGLPCSRQRVRVASMELAGDIAADADAGGGGAGVRPRPRDGGLPVVAVAVAEGDVGHER